MNWNKLKEYGPSLVRYAVGLVFLLIGIDQFIHPLTWAGYFPSSLPFGLTAAKAVFLNGIFDTAIGILLIIGLFTRIVAAIAALHLIGVIYTIGYNEIAIRDLGILIAALSIFFNGADKCCLDRIIRKSYS